MANKSPRFPTKKNRMVIIGRTGSGKTQAAVWHLSRTNFDEMPWVIFNFKGDELIDGIEKAVHIPLGVIPASPGLYVVHPLPSQQGEVEDYLWQLWEHGNVGIYIDEGFMLGINKAFEAILTQGRSKNIPVIVLSQRPAWITRFVFSEADFFQVFHLNDRRDKKTVEAFVPQNLSMRLPDYHSFYYDVGRDSLCKFKPVPDASSLLETFNARFSAMQDAIADGTTNNRKFI